MAFHAIFNALGVCWILSIFRPVFIPLVEQTAHVLKLQLIPFGIPLAHSLFNITNALLFLPFTKILARFLIRVIPERENTGQSSETGLDSRFIESSLIAVLKSRLIIEQMGQRCCDLVEELFRQVQGPLDNEKGIQQSSREEGALDRVQDEIIRFCSKVFSMNPTADSAQEARQQIRIADEIESVSDCFISLLKSDLKLKNDRVEMPAFVKKRFQRLDQETLVLFREINRAYGNRVKARYFLERVYSTCRRLTAEVKDLRSVFMTEVEQEHYDQLLIVAVNSQLTFYRRIWVHLQNIAEVFCAAK